MSPSLVWLRRDLRLADQPALQAALARGHPIVPVYIHAPEEEAPWAPGAASRWWLHHSLRAFARSLEAVGSRLIIRHGPSLLTLQTLGAQTGADHVFWNRLYEPACIQRDRDIKQQLRAAGYQVHSFNSSLLREPWTVVNGSGDPYRVFSPFWKTCKRLGIAHEAPLAAVTRLPAVPETVSSLALDDLALLPTVPWDSGLAAAWVPGEATAQQRLQAFIADALAYYHKGRDFPGQAHTSGLSPALHFGEIAPRQILFALYAAGLDVESGNAEHFIREVGWREFAYHLLYHFPQTVDTPLNPQFADFPWRDSAADLARWQRGGTGVPMVDAGMRQLWQTGWMHNRVRMIAGSFLTKNLRLHWLQGARWFWDTLVDADLASNTLGWQWVAGSGADAAPYFRVFNPVLQGQRFDPQGAYVRRYIPELAACPDGSVHAPWTRPGSTPDYPPPMVDLAVSRDAALAAYEQIKAGGRERTGTVEKGKG